jgi:hypothetical protein
VHIENTGYPDTWKELSVLVMSYSNMKPMKPEFHDHIARWVREGGVLLYCGKDIDPYQETMEWWNTEGHAYTAPSMHLFERLGLASSTPQTGEYACGKGKVYVLREEPKDFVLQPDSDETYFSTVRRAFTTAPNTGRLETKNNFCLERGAYVIASVMDESVSNDPLVLNGLFIDLFDPELPVLQRKTVLPGEQAYLYDVKKIADKGKPSVLCGASRIYGETVKGRVYSFIAKSPAETNNVTRVYLPRKPSKVTVKNAAGDYSWDAASQTCLIKFENDPDGVPVVIGY